METLGQIERRFQPPLTPKATFEPLFVPGRANLPLQEAAKIPFTVPRVVVENSTVYTEHELRPLYEPYLNRQGSSARSLSRGPALPGLMAAHRMSTRSSSQRLSFLIKPTGRSAA